MIQHTLVIIKPDAVSRGLTGEIITRFEKRGLGMARLEKRKATQQEARAHYAELEEKYGNAVFQGMVNFLCSGPVVLMVVEGHNVVPVVRKMVGSTYPAEAEPGTIRGDYAHVHREYSKETNKIVKNLVHASDSPESAAREILLWFPDCSFSLKPQVRDDYTNFTY